MESREDRIRIAMHRLAEQDDRAGEDQRKYWDQATAIIEEEDRRAAQATVDPNVRRTAGDDETPVNEPIGVTLTAMRRQN
jgi:hypothetical protein